MSDIRNPARFLAGRWAWTAGGYERNLGPCGFGDIDAMLERDGRVLFIECKDGDVWNGWTYPPTGQARALRALAGLDDGAHTTVWILYGIAAVNDPQLLVELDAFKPLDRVRDWRHLGIEGRRVELERLITRWWRND